MAKETDQCQDTEELYYKVEESDYNTIAECVTDALNILFHDHEDLLIKVETLEEQIPFYG